MIDGSTLEQAPAGAVSNAEGRSVTFVKTWWNMEKSMLRCRDHEKRVARAKEWVGYVEELVAFTTFSPDDAQLFFFRLADIFRLEKLAHSRMQGGPLWQLVERINQYDASGTASQAEEYPGLVEEMVATFRDIMRNALHEIGRGELAEAYYAEPEAYERRMLANAPRADTVLLSQAIGRELAREFHLEHAIPWSKLIH